MYWMDIIALIIMIWFVFKDYSSGLIVSLFRFLGLLLGIILSVKYGYFITEFLINKLSVNEGISQFIGYLIVFIIVLIIVQIIGNLLKSTMNIILLGWLDKVGGAILGFAKASILISILFWGIMMLPANRLTEAIKYESKSYSMFENVAPTMYKIIIQPFIKEANIKKHFDKVTDKFDKFKSEKKITMEDLSRILDKFDDLTLQDIQYIKSIYTKMPEEERKEINNLLKQGEEGTTKAIEILNNY